MASIAVTGSSGQLGRLVADQLLAAPGLDSAEVTLLSRDPAGLAGYADQGAAVRRADYAEPATLVSALEGVERLLLISIDEMGPQRIERQRNAIEAARAAGVTLIAYTSVPRPVPGNRAGVVPDHAATETMLRESGLAWTFLRNNIYADMQVSSLEQATRTGQWITNTGAGAAAFVTRADCAAAAVGVLTGDVQGNQAYDVTGPEAWTAESLAVLAAQQGNRSVEVVDVDDAAYAAGLQEAGLPASAAELLTSFGAATREGYFGTVTDVVANVGGRPPTSLRYL